MLLLKADLNYGTWAPVSLVPSLTSPNATDMMLSGSASTSSTSAKCPQLYLSSISLSRAKQWITTTQMMASPCPPEQELLFDLHLVDSFGMPQRAGNERRWMIFGLPRPER